MVLHALGFSSDADASKLRSAMSPEDAEVWGLIDPGEETMYYAIDCALDGNVTKWKVVIRVG